MGTDVEKNFFSNTENLQHAAKPSRVIGNIQDTIRADYERNKTLRSVSRILGWAKRLLCFPGAILTIYGQVGFFFPY